MYTIAIFVIVWLVLTVVFFGGEWLADHIGRRHEES